MPRPRPQGRLPDRETLVREVFESFGEAHLESLILALIHRRLFGQLGLETKQALVLSLLDLGTEVVIPAAVYRNQAIVRGRLLNDPLRILYTRYQTFFGEQAEDDSENTPDSEPDR